MIGNPRGKPPIQTFKAIHLTNQPLFSTLLPGCSCLYTLFWVTWLATVSRSPTFWQQCIRTVVVFADPLASLKIVRLSILTNHLHLNIPRDTLFFPKMLNWITIYYNNSILLFVLLITLHVFEMCFISLEMECHVYE